jgi:hypothetical protein
VLALVESSNLCGIVALIVDFERRAREHFGREFFYSVSDGFSGLGKAAVSEPRTALCRKQLGGCRVVEGEHEANIVLFSKMRAAVALPQRRAFFWLSHISG